jgi:hypothetical protein
MSSGSFGAKHRADVTVDDILMRVLEGGPLTVKNIVDRLEGPVQSPSSAAAVA